MKLRPSFQLLIGMVFLLAVNAQEQDSQRLPEKRFLEKVVAIDGRTVDVKALAQNKTLVVVTLKATWCPVCQSQLMRIKERLSESEACGISYLVLAPGPREELLEIQKKIKFRFPFIEDKDLQIAKSLGLQMSEEEILPAIFILTKDLKVGWMQAGRSDAQYGDPALFEEVRCAGWI